MDKDKAWALLSDATARLQLDRAGHGAVMEALRVLKPEPQPAKEEGG